MEQRMQVAQCEEPVPASELSPRRVAALLVVLAAHLVAALGLWWADRAQWLDTLSWAVAPGFGLLGYFLLLGFISAGCGVPANRVAAVLVCYGAAFSTDALLPWLWPLSAGLPVEPDHLGMVLGVFPVLAAAVLVYELPRIPFAAKPAFWIAGVYLIAIHLYNGLDPYEQMRLFGGGEIV